MLGWQPAGGIFLSFLSFYVYNKNLIWQTNSDSLSDSWSWIIPTVTTDQLKRQRSMIADTIWPTRLHYWSFSTSLSFANNKFLVYTAPPASCGYFFISLSKKIIYHTAPKQLYFPTIIWNWTQKLLIKRYLTNKTQTKSLKHNREPNVHYFAPNADLCGPLKKNPTHIFYMHILCATLVILRGDSHALKNANAKTRKDCLRDCMNSLQSLLKLTWIYQHRIYAKTPFCMCTIDLHHWELDLGGGLIILDSEIAHMVKNPVSRVIQTAFGHCFLAVWCWKLKPDGLNVPPMNLFQVANSSTESFWSFA